MVFQKIKSFLFNFFHFNKQERNGVFVLCIIIAMLFGVRLLMPLVNNDSNSVQFITIAPSEKRNKHSCEFSKSNRYRGNYSCLNN